MTEVPREFEALLPGLLQLGAEAGEVIMAVYRRGFTVQQKADDTPLTEADLVADAIIRAGLQALAPEVPVLSEEGVHPPFAERQTWTRHWLVDPLDGTRQFIRRTDEFTVNIALIQDHVPVLGLIHVPATGVSYFAVRSGGSRRLRPGEGPPQSLHVRPRPAGPLRVLASRCRPGSRLAAFLDGLKDAELMSVGSALKSCLIAEGEADLYPRFGPTGEWDTAAAQLIVEEAGGQVVDLHMRPLRYNTGPSLINPHFLAVADASVDWSRYLSPTAP